MKNLNELRIKELESALVVALDYANKYKEQMCDTLGHKAIDLELARCQAVLHHQKPKKLPKSHVVYDLLED